MQMALGDIKLCPVWAAAAIANELEGIQAPGTILLSWQSWSMIGSYKSPQKKSSMPFEML